MEPSTRQQLIEAASRIMADQGVSGLTTKEVARAAGRSEGSIYNHFRDKLELAGEVVASKLPALKRALGGMQPGERTVAVNLERAVRALVDFYRDMEPLLASVISDPELRARFQAKLRPLDLGPHRSHRAVAEYLTAEQDLGRLDPDVDAVAVAFLLVSACHESVFLDVAVGVDRAPIRRRVFAHTVVSTLLAGLIPTEPREEDR